MKKNILIALLFLSCFMAKAQIGIGTPMPDPSAVLELKSTTRGFLPPSLTTVQRDAIISPKVGLMIYNTSRRCLEWYNGTFWYNGCGIDSSSGGSAVISGYSSVTASSGTLTVGNSASGVTQTITALVGKVGSYDISVTVNGVTFTASGIFTGTGPQNIVLTASGTPLKGETSNFVLNTTPSISFPRTIVAVGVEGSSNGTAVVSGYSPSTTSTGTLTAGTPASGVTQTITATVGSIGTYNILTIANGVTYTGSGTFTGTGQQNIVLTATGIPLKVQTSNFVLNTTPSISFPRTTVAAIVGTSVSSGGSAIVSAYTGATASTGTLTAGTPVTGVTQTITATVGSVGTYSITKTINGVTFTGSGTFSGTGQQDIVLTATGTPVVAGVSNFVLDTAPAVSFSRTILDAGSNGSSGGTGIVSAYAGATASTGTLTAGTPATGVTQTITATVGSVGTYTITKTINGVTFTGSGTFSGTGQQDIVLTATGTPVVAGVSNFVLDTTPSVSFFRTILDAGSNGSSGGTGIVSAYTGATTSTGTLIAGTPASGVTQTITATVGSVGTYNITKTINGITYSGSGTFTGTGQQDIVLTATGTPIVAGTSNFVLDTTPSVSFSRTILAAGSNGSSGGTGIVSGYTGATASTGTLTAGTAVSGVTQTITATVGSVGTYSITKTINGVTFTGSGTFSGTGQQDIILTATGTPVVAGITNFTLDTTPAVSFSRTILDAGSNGSSGGTAVVTSYTNKSSSGTLTAGTPASGVTQTITATIGSVGTYNITTITNGVTFTGSGTFTGTGQQDIVLTATGTPVASGITNFTLDTTPTLSFSRVIVSATSGGTAVVTSYSNKSSAGTLTAGTTVSGVTQTITATVGGVGTYTITTISNGVTFTGSGTFSGTGQQDIVLTSTGTPVVAGTSNFILDTTPSVSFSRTILDAGSNGSSGGTAVVSAYTGATASTGTLTAGTPASGVTQTITATVGSIGTYNITKTINGVTFTGSGTFSGTGQQDIVLTATGTPVVAGTSNFILDTTPSVSFSRTILDAGSNGSSGGTAVVTSYTNKSSSGTLTAGTPASGVTQTITATVGGVGTYNITTITNGVTFTGSGTFSGTGQQDIVLTATGTPVASGITNFTLDTTPTLSFPRIIVSATSGGTAVVTSYSNKSSAGTLNAGTAVSGVTQTITATVGRVGTYSITAIANGVTFTGSGTFTGTGSQDIVLIATGTPVVVETSNFVLNTTPTLSFPRTIVSSIDLSSGGTAVVTSYSNKSSAGTLNAGTAVSGVTQTITATVGSVGTYSITAIANGVTFTGSGTFTGTGSQDIVIIATGTPVVVETSSFSLNTTPTLSFTRVIVSVTSGGTAVVTSYSNKSSAGTLNAGTAVSGVTQTITATVGSVGTYSITAIANGVTFTGSGTFAGTGSQDIVLTTTGTPVVVGTTSFSLNTTPTVSFPRTILAAGSNASSGGTAVVSAYTGATASTGTLTAGTPASGVTQTITATVGSVGNYNITKTINGVTYTGSGTFSGTGQQDIILTATGTPIVAGITNFTFDTTPAVSFPRTILATGSDGSSGGTAAVTSYISKASSGTLTVGTAVSGVTQTITATVGNVGTYNISAITNGVMFTGSGTFSGTGQQDIVLTATGTPVVSGSTNYALDTTPTVIFSRTILASGSNGSSGGYAVVSAYTGATASTGTLTAGTPVTGVTQTITATVSTVGTYSITKTINGVTFTGSGTFSGTGQQNIVLTATGTPIVAGITNFTSDTTPAVSFPRTILATGSDGSSGGTAVVSAYTGATASTGTLTVDTPVTGVTQTITATVGSVGTYNITTITNGVTFTGSGTFTGTGQQDVVLTATGTPTVAGTSNFTLDTTPSVSFPRVVADLISATSGGTAVISSYRVYAPDSFYVGYTVPYGRRYSIIAFVDKVGSYNITTNTINGLTYTGSGTFTVTGGNVIALEAIGIPLRIEVDNFVSNTIPTFTIISIGFGKYESICDGSAPTMVVDVLSSTGKIWMDRNLGAFRAAVGHNDHDAYGCLYQWGRGNDGHASVIWDNMQTQSTKGTVNGTTSSLSTTNNPGDALFIINPNYDWRSVKNDALWQGVLGVNNPCPSGYRVPTEFEFAAEAVAYKITNFDSAYDSPHKFILAGYRNMYTGDVQDNGVRVRLWTSTVNAANARAYNFSNLDTYNIVNSFPRSTGFSVRCIKD
ncbi:hypothetical protein EKL99_01215 [Flavobacterium sp. ZB4P23]|uniref:FISUMP domain-containing protein n=1 Tax=Flavobacterium sp. ZB4P23 TaxID=2497484 RepID=UPI000F816500|nr:FISUMP domain-containing protein [Flavobacterium sp. ZB4P23]RTY84644.1 hypothetical protein EKL99_01215 [Flavobacterium sp. ZB4P23]